MANKESSGGKLRDFLEPTKWGISFALQRRHYHEAFERITAVPFNLISLIKENNNPSGAVHQCEMKFSSYHGKPDLLMINQKGPFVSKTSLQESLLNLIAFTQIVKKEEPKEAKFQYHHSLALIKKLFALKEKETLFVFLPHGQEVSQGVALAQFTRQKDGVKFQSQLLPKITDQQAEEIMEGLVDLGGERINLKEDKDLPLWIGVKMKETPFNFVEKRNKFSNFLKGVLGQEFLQQETPNCQSILRIKSKGNSSSEPLNIRKDLADKGKDSFNPYNSQNFPKNFLLSSLIQETVTSGNGESQVKIGIKSGTEGKSKREIGEKMKGEEEEKSKEIVGSERTTGVFLIDNQTRGNFKNFEKIVFNNNLNNKTATTDIKNLLKEDLGKEKFRIRQAVLHIRREGSRRKNQESIGERDNVDLVLRSWPKRDQFLSINSLGEYQNLQATTLKPKEEMTRREEFVIPLFDFIFLRGYFVEINQVEDKAEDKVLIKAREKTTGQGLLRSSSKPFFLQEASLNTFNINPKPKRATPRSILIIPKKKNAQEEILVLPSSSLIQEAVASGNGEEGDEAGDRVKVWKNGKTSFSVISKIFENNERFGEVWDQDITAKNEERQKKTQEGAFSLLAKSEEEKSLPRKDLLGLRKEEEARRGIVISGYETDLLDDQKAESESLNQQKLKEEKNFSQNNNLRVFFVKDLRIKPFVDQENNSREKLEVNKLVFLIRSGRQSLPAIFELEMPKDQNQRTYAFLHFLRKVIKRFFGEDKLWNKSISVIKADRIYEKEVDLFEEIDYYLSLLRKEKYAQIFAFVN